MPDEKDTETELTAADLAAAESSSDNNYVGETVAIPKAGAEDNYAPLPFVEENAQDNYLFYKHKLVLRFEIPRANSLQDPFKFVSGIAKIHKDDEQEFLKACAGLHRGDSGNIVQIRNIQNEVALKRPEPTAFRQAASTHTIIAPTADRPAATASNRDSAPPGTRQPQPVGLGALLAKK